MGIFGRSFSRAGRRTEILQKLSAFIELVVIVADFLAPCQNSADMRLLVAACVILIAAGGEPAGDHAALGIKEIFPAADIPETCRHSSLVRGGGKTEIIVIVPDFYETGQDLSHTFFALHMAGEISLTAGPEETDFHVSV